MLSMGGGGFFAANAVASKGLFAAVAAGGGGKSVELERKGKAVDETWALPGAFPALSFLASALAAAYGLEEDDPGLLAEADAPPNEGKLDPDKSGAFRDAAAVVVAGPYGLGGGIFVPPPREGKLLAVISGARWMGMEEAYGIVDIGVEVALTTLFLDAAAVPLALFERDATAEKFGPATPFFPVFGRPKPNAA
mmetsp:Transcript_1842/g.4009  ORF Transcript_1842/g.4009 Transcript_1842/m.4009 type:complete len:194 (-) Transcript_1842:1031-1612(-)